MKVILLIIPCAVSSILSAFWLLKQCGSFCKELIENSGKEKVLIQKSSDYLPRRIRRQLQEIPRLKKMTVEELLKSYKRLCKAFSGYVLVNLIHIACIFKIMQVMDYSSMNTAEALDTTISYICVDIILLYLLFTVPVIKIFYGKGFIEEIKSDIWRFLKQVIFDIFMCILSFNFLHFWISHMETFATDRGIKLTFWTELGILIIYQYLLLMPISCIVHHIILALDKILCWVARKISTAQEINAFLVKSISFCKQYAEHNQIHSVLKNCTYFILVLVYTWAIKIGCKGEAVAGALGVLFLIDTFFSQEKAITWEVFGCKDDRNKEK